MILTEEVAKGQRNHTFRITGTVDDPKMIIEVKSSQPRLKLTGAVWFIQEKMGFCLSWDKKSVLMPLESRNSVRFDQAIPCPEGWQGSLWLRPFKVTELAMAFFIILDFDK